MLTRKEIHVGGTNKSLRADIGVGIPFYSFPTHFKTPSSIWAEPEPGAGDLKVFRKEVWKVTRGQLFPLSIC